MSKYLICDENGMIYYRGRVYPFINEDITYDSFVQANNIVKKLGGTWHIEEINNNE